MNAKHDHDRLGTVSGNLPRGVAQESASGPAAFAVQSRRRLIRSLIAFGVAIAIYVALGYPVLVIACAAMGATGAVLAARWTTASDLVESSQRLQEVASLIAGPVVTAASIGLCRAAGRTV